jgi:serine/threonine-protein kinase
MPMVGDLLGDRYEIESVLGAGGMASVYRAVDLRLQREVAVKVLLPNLAADPIVASRFEREARALAGAAHPGIVAVFDVEPGDPESGREPYYVMELCDGGSLADRMVDAGRLAPPEVVPVLASIADGLAAMHEQGLIHRDVKPHNILICGGRPKLGDFGLARSEHPVELTRLTADGTTLGTLPYLAPELLAGSPPTVASDVYALGVTAYQALTGELPRPFGSLREMVEHRADVPPPASTHEPALGPAFDEALASALALTPAERPAPQAFATALTNALGAWTAAAEAPADAAKTAAFAIASVRSRGSLDEVATETMVLPAAPPEPAAPEPAPTPEPASEAAPALASAGAAAPPQAAPPQAAPPQPPGPRATRRTAASLALPSLRLTDPATRRVLAAGAAIVGLAAFVVVAAVLGRTLGSAGFFDASDLSPAASRPAAAASPSVAPSPSPTAPNPALAAVDAVVAAIDAARGGKNGLKGGEANDLIGLASSVRNALESGDFEEARDLAGTLADRAAKTSKDLDKDRRSRLLGAIETLRDAIPQED